MSQAIKTFKEGSDKMCVMEFSQNGSFQSVSEAQAGTVSADFLQASSLNNRSLELLRYMT